MKSLLRLVIVMPALIVAAHAQTPETQAPSKTEFEAASIRVNPPQTGFRFAADSGSGGPGSENPGMFRCSTCTLATLIGKAFDLQNYQFPGQTSLGDNTFEVMARIPAGATPADFQVMLQNLLKDRFGLAYQFKEKSMRGYHLVVGKNGSKLKESTANARAAVAATGSSWGGGGHTHSGLAVFGGSASYRGDHTTTADLARVCSDQLSLPVDDQTGLQGKYDVALTWAGSGHSAGNHTTEGSSSWSGAAAGHGDHGGGGGVSSGPSRPASGDATGPTLFDALQSQLGLKLVPSEQTVARIFVLDHVEKIPTAN